LTLPAKARVAPLVTVVPLTVEPRALSAAAISVPCDTVVRPL
jgi:hypothetical protein